MTREEAISILSRPRTMKNAPSDILKAHEMAIQAIEQTRWIPVSERLPKDGIYLICTDDDYIATIMYDRSMGWLLDSNIIAWMPLPQPMKVGEENC